jgi:catalase
VDGKHQRYTAVGLKIGVFVCDGFDKAFILAVQNELIHAGTTCAIVGPRAGFVHSGSDELQTQFSFETCRSTLFDAILFVPGSDRAVMNTSGRLIHAAREAYMHQKPIAAVGHAAEWISDVPLRGFIVGAGGSGPEVERGVVLMKGGGVGLAKDFSRLFLSLLEKHRIWDRDVSEVGA